MISPQACVCEFRDDNNDYCHDRRIRSLFSQLVNTLGQSRLKIICDLKPKIFSLILYKTKNSNKSEHFRSYNNFWLLFFYIKILSDEFPATKIAEVCELYQIPRCLYLNSVVI